MSPAIDAAHEDLPSLDWARDGLERFCGRHHIRRLWLFGSWASGEARPDSDVDLLVEFAPGSDLSAFDFVEVRQGLSALFGKEVDLLEEEALRNPFRRAHILRTRRLLYES